jgi:hypothetical protein
MDRAMPLFRLRLALQGEQLTRWFVIDAAYAHGWFLKSEEGFDSRQFPGYEPKRNHVNEAFPVDKAIMYTFEYALVDVVDELRISIMEGKE